METPTIDKPELSNVARLRRYEDLPGPRGIPVFGNLLQVESSRFHQQLEAWCEDFGPVFRLKLGPRRAIVVGDHELVAAALRDRPDGYRRTTRLEEIWTELGLQGGVFGANGDVWRRQRRMVMNGFDPAHVKRYYPSMQRVAQRLIGRWRLAAQQDRTIDLQADLMRYTVDTIAGLAFGAEVNTLQSDADVIQNHLNRLFPAVYKRIFSPLPTWRYFPTAADRALRRSVAEVNSAVEGFVAQARARLQADPALRARPANLLEAMLVAADEPDSGIDDLQVAGNVLVMLLAGEDTTANTLAWMIHLLWRNPSALAMATDEVRRVCGAGEVATLEQLAQLDFVEACAHETMRLKPVGPLNIMQALHDTALGDLAVPQGMLIVAVMRRDSVSERHVPRPHAFEPQRWLVEGGPAHLASAAKRISMPFGAGPRICPGRYLALMEMKLAMATLLQHFEIGDVGTRDGREPRELLQLAMGPVGLWMRLRARAGAVVPAQPVR